MVGRESYIGPVILMIGTFLPVNGCSPLFSLPDTPSDRKTFSFHQVSGVPFYPQEELQCGPASLASLLNFWGEDTQPGEIAGQVYLERLGGSLPLDLELYARRIESSRPWRVVVTRDDPDVLRRELGSGHPIVLFLDLGFWVWKKGHFIIGVGYDDIKREVIAHSGRNRESKIPYDSFFKQWARTHYWSLHIVPENGHEN